MSQNQTSVVRQKGPEEQRYDAIQASRLMLTEAHAGLPVRCKISGNPLIGYLDERVKGYDGSVGALKDIYSFNVKKATVLRAKWFIKSHVAAIMLERAGKVTEARAAFNELLNFSQLTLGIINRDGLKPQYAANTPVEVMVSIVDAPDLDDAKNKLETTHKALVADSMVPLASVNLSKGGDAYDIEAMLMDGVNITGGDEEEEEVPAPKPEPKATKKAAK